MEALVSFVDLGGVHAPYYTDNDLGSSILGMMVVSLGATVLLPQAEILETVRSAVSFVSSKAEVVAVVGSGVDVVHCSISSCSAQNVWILVVAIVIASRHHRFHFVVPKNCVDLVDVQSCIKTSYSLSV